MFESTQQHTSAIPKGTIVEYERKTSSLESSDAQRRVWTTPTLVALEMRDTAAGATIALTETLVTSPS